MKPRLIVIALVCLVTSLVAPGCKQGAGERCQVNSDCASNICSSSAPQVCVNSDDNQDQAPFDAEVPVQIDAAIDAAAPDGP